MTAANLRVGICLMVAFFLSDFGATLHGRLVVAAAFALWLFGLFLFGREQRTIKRYIPAYGALMCALLAVNSAFGIGFNFVVFVPLISYAAFLFVGDEHADIAVEKIALGILYFIVMPLVALEVLVKLGLLDLPQIRNLIVASGSGRIDVLRAQSPFGSPLSLASLAFVLVFYFSFFTERKKEVLLAFIILIMTGSRTALAASTALVLGRLVVRALSAGAHRRFDLLQTLAVTISLAALMIGTVLYLNAIGLDSITDRVLSLESYNVTADRSFLDRGQTTLAALSQVISDLPRSLVLGQKEALISDSAFASIATQSGVITAVAFFFLFLRCASRLPIGQTHRLIFVSLFIVLVAMVGDAVVPLVAFLYFLIFFTYTGERPRDADTRAQRQRPLDFEEPKSPDAAPTVG